MISEGQRNDINYALPSVSYTHLGAGDVFRQLILCGKIPVTVLNLVYRQGKDSNIPINAQLINEGKTNLQWGDDFQMVECSGADAAAQIVKNIYLKEIQMYGMEQVQIPVSYTHLSLSLMRYSCQIRYKVYFNIAKPD